MENHHKIVLGMALCLGLVTCGGYATAGHPRERTEFKAQSALPGMTSTPGTQPVASYKKTAEQPPCKGTPALVVEHAALAPSKITPGQQMVSRIVYVSCYATSLQGQLIRKVMHNGKTMVALPENIEYRPGTWALTVYIAMAPGAHPGGYQLETAAAEQHAAVPPVEAPDRPQAVAPPQAHTKPEDSRVDTANRHPHATMLVLESVPPLVIIPESVTGGVGAAITPPVKVWARRQEGEPQQRPSGQRPRSSKVAQVLRRAAQRAKQQKPSAMTSQEPPGGAGWKIITK